MTIYKTVLASYPELENSDVFVNNIIVIQDDSDGVGAYIAKWEYSKPIPTGLKLGKPKS